jgi:hypothetical protein
MHSPSQVQYDPWIEHLAYLMDSSIGIGPWSVGIDPLLGLIPGIGDLAGAVISMLLVMRAVRAGVPRIAVVRMVTNIVVDTLVGTIPLVGDLFDFAYKSSIKNLRIYEESLRGRRAAVIQHWIFFAALAVVLVVLLAIPIVAVLRLIRAI